MIRESRTPSANSSFAACCLLPELLTPAPEEAIRAYTVWSVYAAHWEEATGILAPGRWADLTVLDVDPLVVGETDPGALLDGAIVATIVAGEIVHRSSP